MREYQAPYKVFIAAYNDIREALIKICVDKKYEDAAFIPAMISVSANLAILSQSTDAEIIDQFQKALFDARTRNLQKKPH